MYNVVFILDDKYAIPTKAAINSIVRNVADAEITVHVIAVGLSAENKASILRLKGGRVVIRILDCENEFSALKTAHRYVSKAALFKFILPKIFKDLDRILYLDGDMILSRGIIRIFDVNISDSYAAVVADLNVDLFASRPPGLQSRAEMFGHVKYFNSGMMYINLEKWRVDGIGEKLIEYKKNASDETFMDQDALNAVIGGNVRYISPTFNPIRLHELCGDFFFPDGNGVAHVAKYFGLPCEEMRTALENPVVRHFAGSAKPWFNPGARHAEEWFEYAAEEDRVEVLRRYCAEMSKSLEIVHRQIDVLGTTRAKQSESVRKQNDELRKIVNEIRGIAPIGIYIELRNAIRRHFVRR